jgi:hypothetical protein
MTMMAGTKNMIISMTTIMTKSMATVGSIRRQSLLARRLLLLVCERSVEFGRR